MGFFPLKKQNLGKGETLALPITPCPPLWALLGENIPQIGHRGGGEKRFGVILACKPPSWPFSVEQLRLEPSNTPEKRGFSLKNKGMPEGFGVALGAVLGQMVFPRDLELTMASPTARPVCKGAAWICKDATRISKRAGVTRKRAAWTRKDARWVCEALARICKNPA